jgi:hypothetical protein
MLRAATSFDLRQHLIDNGIVGEDLPEGCVEALQEIGDSFILAAYEGHSYFLSHRSQGRATDRRYFTDRDLTSRVIEESLDMFEGGDRSEGIFH